MANETVVQFGASLVGRLARTDLSASHGLQPVYEALSNSLHSIEDGKLQGGRISIRVFRDDTQTRLKDEAGHLICRPIKDVHIEDNGVGFTEANFLSFCTADSLHKHARGGKGIGRLLWLKAFATVEVTSLIAGSGSLSKRSFRFQADDKSPITKHALEADNGQERQTIVRLLSFRAPYREACRHKPETLAGRVIRHYLLHFLRPDCPAITLLDDDADHAMDLNKRHSEGKASDVETDSIRIGSHDLTVVTVRARSSGKTITGCICAPTTPK
jgi:hypothetical protein